MASRLGVNDVFFKEMHLRPYNDRVAVLSKSKASRNENTPRICLNGWFQLVIGPDTMYSLCCQIKPSHPIDFEKCSLKKFWLSKQMMKMRLLIKKGHVLKKYKDCQTCQSSYKNSERLKDVLEIRKK